MQTQQKESFSEIINADTPVLVDFTAVWCGPCQMMKPILEDLHKALGDAVRIIKIDIDKSPKTAEAYNISGVPTLILFRQGRILWRQSGVVPAKQLEQAIKMHAGV